VASGACYPRGVLPIALINNLNERSRPVLVDFPDSALLLEGKASGPVRC
jgi:hypothetical protein